MLQGDRQKGVRFLVGFYCVVVLDWGFFEHLALYGSRADDGLLDWSVFTAVSGT